METDKVKNVNDKIKSCLDNALSFSDAESKLINLVEELKSQGWSQIETYDVFVTYQFFLEETNQEKDAEILTEVVSYIYGWCGDSAKLFGRTMSNEEIRRYRESKN